jgi:response regulator of citrate/malate metabolism
MSGSVITEAKVEDAIDRARSGVSTVLDIAGHGGFGKSRLLRHVGAHFAPEHVLRATAFEDSQGEPLGMLAQLGVDSTHTATEAILALRVARTGDPVDLLLLDMNLPDMFGLELCRRMRAEGVAADVIAVTANRDAEVVRTAVHLGIVQYLIKPFTFGAFARKLAAYHAYAAGIAEATVTDQHDVDAMFSHLRPDAIGALPKTITGDTRDRVRSALVGAQSWASASVLHLKFAG